MPVVAPPAPSPIPSWLAPWTVWVLEGKIVTERPNAPAIIPDWAKWFPAWCRWRLNGRPTPRPANLPADIPQWAMLELGKVVHILRRAAGLAFFRRMSCWVTRIDHFPLVYAEAYCKDEYPVVVVPCLKGADLESYPDGTQLTYEGLIEYVRALQAAGFEVVGSQWGRAEGLDQVEIEADAAVAAIKRVGFDGWVFNGEKIYEGGDKSKVYARRFRTFLPYFPFGWSPEARLSLNHDVLQELGVCYMPQAYPLENGVALHYAVEWAENFGYDVAKEVVPLIGAYEVRGERYPATLYRDEARQLGLPALCLYTANQAVDVPSYWRNLVV